MGRRRSENSVRRIVSFRVNENEYQELERWSVLAGKPISTMLRGLLTQMNNPFDRSFTASSLSEAEMRSDR